MIIDEIREELFRLCDTEYRDFQVRLIPTVAPELVIGVRTPVLRKYAGQLLKREERTRVSSCGISLTGILTKTSCTPL